MEGVDLLEPKEASLKWSSKPGIQRSEFFDPEDSWFDSPPEGFNLSVSILVKLKLSLFLFSNFLFMVVLLGFLVIAICNDVDGNLCID